MNKLSKNAQIILLSAIGLVILVGIVLVLVLTDPNNKTVVGDSSDEKDEDEGISITDYEPTQVDKIVITNTNGEYTVDRIPAKSDDDNDTWLIEAISQAEQDQTKFTALAKSAASISASKLVEENAQLSTYGLEKPQATVKITFTDDKTVSFRVGDEAPTDSSTYFCLDGEDEVYIVSTSSLESFLLSELDYVDTAIMAEYDSDAAPVVQRLTIERKDLPENIVIEEIPTEDDEDETSGVYQTHQFVSPVEAYVDISSGGDIVYGMYGLSAGKAAYVGITDKLLEETGITDPTCKVTMQVAGKKYVLTLGNAIEETLTNDDGSEYKSVTGYYGTFSEIDDVIFIFNSADTFWESINFEDYMSKLFFTPYLYTISGLKIEADGESYDFKLNELTPETEDEDGNKVSATYEVKLNGEKTDLALYKSLYQFIIGAYGESVYLDEPTGELLAKYTYTYADSTKDDVVIEFYDSPEDRKAIIKINGQPLFKVRAAYTDRLVENLKAYVEGGTINTDW